MSQVSSIRNPRGCGRGRHAHEAQLCWRPPGGSSAL